MIKPIFCATSGLLPEVRLYSEAPTQLAGMAVPPSNSAHHAVQCRNVWLAGDNCVSAPTVWFCWHLPLGIAGESIFLSLITLTCGKYKSRFS